MTGKAETGRNPGPPVMAGADEAEKPWRIGFPPGQHNNGEQKMKVSIRQLCNVWVEAEAEIPDAASWDSIEDWTTTGPHLYYTLPGDEKPRRISLDISPVDIDRMTAGIAIVRDPETGKELGFWDISIGHFIPPVSPAGQQQKGKTP